MKGTIDVGTEFRTLMRGVASTVVVVTSYVGGRPWGTTISGFMSVSVEPPLCLVSLFRHNAICNAILERGHFGVSVLSSDLTDVARLASMPGKPKYIDSVCSERSLEKNVGEWNSDFVSGIGGSGGDGSPWSGRDPEIYGALAHIDCDVHSVTPVADHALIIGRVREVTSLSDEPDPLLYMAGRYRQIGETLEGDR